MLAKMKQELARSKTAENELENQLSQQAQANQSRSLPGDWERERDTLQTEMSELQKSLKTSVTTLEGKINILESSLATAEKERDMVRQTLSSSQQEQLRLKSENESLIKRTRAELERLEQENVLLEERAQDAEHKVQLFLDQFENSVDNYRRMSQVPRAPPTNGTGPTQGGRGHKHHLSVGGESVYSNATDGTDGTDTDNNERQPSTQNASAAPTAPAVSGYPSFAATVTSPWDGDEAESSAAPTHGHGRDRSSTALDSLASELDALRAHWETSKSHRVSAVGMNPALSPIADKSPTESLVDWRKKLGVDDDVDDGDKRKLAPGSSTNGAGINGATASA